MVGVKQVFELSQVELTEFHCSCIHTITFVRLNPIWLHLCSPAQKRKVSKKLNLKNPLRPKVIWSTQIKFRGRKWVRKASLGNAKVANVRATKGYQQVMCFSLRDLIAEKPMNQQPVEGLHPSQSHPSTRQFFEI